MVIFAFFHLAQALKSHLDLQVSNFDVFFTQRLCADITVTVRDEDKDIFPIESLPILIASSPSVTIQSTIPIISTTQGIAHGSICFSFTGSYPAIVYSSGYTQGISSPYSISTSSEVEVFLKFDSSDISLSIEYMLNVELIESVLIYQFTI